MMKSKNLHVVPWLPVLAWAAGIFAASSFPGSAYPRPPFPLADKVMHVALYGPFGLLVARALRRNMGPVAAISLATLIATAYGVTDEVHQLFVPRRSADWRDVVADLIGGFAGAALVVWFTRRRRER